MSASLLIMVCGVTGKSKKHIDHWLELKDLKTAIARRRDGLLVLAKEDADAYDALVEASKRRRASDTSENREGFQASLRAAAEVPVRTAAECCALLGQSVINLKDIADSHFARSTREGLGNQRDEVRTFVEEALSRLRQPP
jgi:formiminotetrahydrofolate cyclodeaminase